METLLWFWHTVQHPTLYAMPIFMVVVGIEAAFYWWDAKNDREPAGTGYLGIDSRTSLTIGLLSFGFVILAKIISLVVYSFIYEQWAPWHLDTGSAWFWLGVVLAVDLGWYCNHRFSHRVRIGWAAHQVHHSSEYFNFGTALRQKWNPWFELLFWLPLPFLGVPPYAIYVVWGFNLIYQFFSHTERVPKLWRPIEFVLNTPSHHRVHHGSDDLYLDRNYGGILILWDRMFGTFQEELHRPTYGLTYKVETYNLLELQYGEFGRIAKDVRAARGLRAKIGYVVGPPGWQPGEEPPAPRTAIG